MAKSKQPSDASQQPTGMRFPKWTAGEAAVAQIRIACALNSLSRALAELQTAESKLSLVRDHEALRAIWRATGRLKAVQDELYASPFAPPSPEASTDPDRDLASLEGCLQKDRVSSAHSSKPQGKRKASAKICIHGIHFSEPCGKCRAATTAAPHFGKGPRRA